MQGVGSADVAALQHSLVAELLTCCRSWKHTIMQMGTDIPHWHHRAAVMLLLVLDVGLLPNGPPADTHKRLLLVVPCCLQVMSKLGAARVIPVHDPKATEPHMAYRQRAMFPDNLLASLNVGQLMHAAEKKENRQKLIDRQAVSTTGGGGAGKAY